MMLELRNSKLEWCGSIYTAIRKRSLYAIFGNVGTKIIESGMMQDYDQRNEAIFQRYEFYALLNRSVFNHL